MLYQIEDVAYVLRVREGPNGFYGTYFCKSCWQGGVKYDPLLPTIEEALAEARHRAAQHHAAKHTAKDRNRETEPVIQPFDTDR